MRRAFTYVELTIVVAIMAILAAIAIPNFMEARTRAGVSRSNADLSMLAMSCETYRLENRAYPLNSTSGKPNGWDLRALTTPIQYLSWLPMDSMTTEDARGHQHERRMTPAPYTYFNAIQLDPKQGLQLVPGPDSTDLPGFHAALLWGLGPSSTLPMQPAAPSTRILEGGKVQILVYDPTNGTVSLGDVYQPVP
ncbi:prepilin-type N-terminal cleavage/methylation domain-containing protein [bacterium]|nr:prepilin-type N-terminal cleavage/methylation domain-containing protein [bacterium]